MNKISLSVVQCGKWDLQTNPEHVYKGASDVACPSVTVRVVVDTLVVSSDRTDCDRIDGDGGVSPSRCCCRGREPWDPNERTDCTRVP